MEDRMNVSDMDVFRSILEEADRADMSVKDLIRAAEHADCVWCLDDAVQMLTIGAIDPDEYLVVYVTKEE
jgi:hypothetical protein